MLANALDVALVVTHADDPRETIWFDSVAELAALNGIPVIRPQDPNTPDVVERVVDLYGLEGAFCPIRVGLRAPRSSPTANVDES